MLKTHTSREYVLFYWILMQCLQANYECCRHHLEDEQPMVKILASNMF